MSWSDDERHHINLMRLGVESIFKEHSEVLPTGIMVMPDGHHVMLGFEHDEVEDMVDSAREQITEQGVQLAAFITEGDSLMGDHPVEANAIREHRWRKDVVAMLVESHTGVRESYQWDIQGEAGGVREIGAMYPVFPGMAFFLPSLYETETE